MYLSRLEALKEEEYRAFQCKLMPNIAAENVLGVRTPLVRALAKELKNDPGKDAFLDALPHRYYEENNLHAFLLETEKDFERCIRRLDAFLPYVDNWATCDSMAPKVLFRHPDELIPKIRQWLTSGHTYTVRFGIEQLMNGFLDERFFPESLAWVAEKQSDEYYVQMMQAWYFATALAKQWEEAIPFLEKRMLSPFVHQKTIQKARESYRITEEQKTYLKSLK